MTLDEWDLEFDMLFNNISSNKAPGITPLEKSIFLTQAQDLVVKELYESFEKDEEVAQYLTPLVKNTTLEQFYTQDNYVSFDIPQDLMFILYEEVTALNFKEGETALVVPVNHDDFYKTYNNPFRGPNRKRVLRTLVGNEIRLYLTYNLKNQLDLYRITYLKKPEPIVLKEVTGYPPFEQYTEGNNCKLPESLHRTILLKAVELAKAVWT